MKLYYAPGTCSLAPIILAEWLDLPLELEKVDHRDKTPEWLAINPLGAVPALRLDDGRVMTQVDAILQYFCALRPEAGLGAGDEPLGAFEVHRWNAFLTGDFHPPFGGWFNPARYTTDHSEASLAAVKAAFAERIHVVTRLLDAHVGEANHVALGRRTFLDAYAYAMLRWLKNLEGGLARYPNLARLVASLEADPGVKAALRRERGA